MALNPEETSTAGDQEPIQFGVTVTPEQWREIHKRSGLTMWDGRARGEYVVGCVLGEPRRELRKRVAAIAAHDRELYREELRRIRACEPGDQVGGIAVRLSTLGRR